METLENCDEASFRPSTFGHPPEPSFRRILPSTHHSKPSSKRKQQRDDPDLPGRQKKKRKRMILAFGTLARAEVELGSPVSDADQVVVPQEAPAPFSAVASRAPCVSQAATPDLSASKRVKGKRPKKQVIPKSKGPKHVIQQDHSRRERARDTSTLTPLPGSPSRSATMATSETAALARPDAASRPIRSSAFCRLLRILGSLRPPSPLRPPTARPPLPSSLRPRVWADSRQELCEALPYYRAFQSSLYMRHRHPFGYLLDSFPAPRDVWAQEGRVIISHGGGQSVRLFDQMGNMNGTALQADQSEKDARVDTLLQAAKNQTPLVLLAGKGYEWFPFQLDCAFVVLGWYWISTTWVEAEPVAEGMQPAKNRDYYHRIKLRFDWVRSQAEPWWIPTADVGLPFRLPLPVRSMELSSDAADFNPIIDPSLPLSPPPSPRSRAGAARRRNNRLSSPALSLTLGHKAHQRELHLKLADSDNPTVGLLTPPSTPPMPWMASNASQSNDLRLSRPYGVVEPSSTPPLTIHTGPTSSAFKACSRLCPSCTLPSPQLYREGWTCLRPHCRQFWLLSTCLGLLPIPPGFSLSYNPDFLARPLVPDHGPLTGPYVVVPPSPTSGLPEDVSDGTSLWRGWVCDLCGRANCRYRWEVWECRSCGRQIGHLRNSKPIRASRLRGWPSSAPGGPVIDKQSDATVTEYELPHAGFVYHLAHDRSAQADGIFEEYQVAAVQTSKPLFERRPLTQHCVKGQMLAQFFAVNSGASYKYAVESQSLTFDDSPACVRDALAFLVDRSTAILRKPVGFNEILSVMYREGQKMSWHDDGEPGLGPIVASLSLGSPATMSWRRKPPRHVPNQKFLLGAAKMQAKPPNPPVTLSITLSHGDIMIMEGSKIQEKYLHRVIPHGFRVAATARAIHVNAALPAKSADAD